MLPSSDVRTVLSTVRRLHGQGLNRAPGSVVHRRRNRTRFIPPRTGPAANWASVMAAAETPEAAAAIGGAASFSVRAWDHETGSINVMENASGREVGRLTPDELIEVRRPSSYPGKRSYLGKIPVPTVAHSSRSVWFESLNELYHYRDLLMTRPIVEFSSQPMEIVWVFSRGLRSHVPDCVVQMNDGGRLLVDVTTSDRLSDPRARAIFRLTAATARSLGWEYELRVEMAAQQQRNISFVLAHRPAAEDQLVDWLKRLTRARLPQSTYSLARVLHDDGLPAPVWGLIALGRLSVDMSLPLRPDTLVSDGPSRGCRDWLVTP